MNNCPHGQESLIQEMTSELQVIPISRRPARQDIKTVGCLQQYNSRCLTQALHPRIIPSVPYPIDPHFGAFFLTFSKTSLGTWDWGVSEWGALDLDQNPCGPWMPVSPFWDILQPSNSMPPHAWHVRLTRCPKELKTPTYEWVVGPVACLLFQKGGLPSRFLPLASYFFHKSGEISAKVLIWSDSNSFYRQGPCMLQGWLWFAKQQHASPQACPTWEDFPLTELTNKSMLSNYNSSFHYDENTCPIECFLKRPAIQKSWLLPFL